MCKKLVLWGALFALLAMLGSARAELVGHWKLDEGGGTVADDSSGNGYDGTFAGAPAWVAGQLGGAIQVDGDDWVDCGDVLALTDALTITCWVKPEAASGIQGFAGRNGAYALKSNGTQMQFTTPGVRDHWGPNFGFEAGTWQHVAASFLPSDGEGLVFYRNGVETDRSDSSALGAGTGPFLIGSNQWGENLNGMIDDVRVYDHILTPEEIAEAMLGGAPEMAANPNPPHEAVDVLRETALAWTSGEFAVGHDVYLGTAFDDVNDADRTDPMDVLVSQGQSGTSYQPDAALDFGQTYYWRVDEVNGAPDNTIFTGDVWSFTVEPFAYAVENVVATSNTSSTTGQGPDRLVDGSGLDENDGHSNETSDMWSGTPNPDEPSYVQFEFDRVYKLHEMLIWNYNMQFESWLGYGVAEATLEYSENGVDWTVLGDVTLPQAPGTNGHPYDAAVSFEGVPARYVRMTVQSSFSAAATVHGLSEVRFLYVPAFAREPQPADGATDLSVDTVLNWRSGRGAATHEIYMGTDPNELTLTATTAQASYAADLQLDTTYYWQVVEVNEAEVWASDIWTFSTTPFIVVDDFESYIDDADAGDVIWEVWIDGLVAYGGDPDNGGSIVGNDTSPFAEQVIVRTDTQAMPLFYSNTSASAISEADRTFATAQDWSGNGIKSLTLWFYGAAGNTGKPYVKINDVKVPYDGDAADIARLMWVPWNIDLSTVGANLSSVTQLSVGVEGAGAGVIYVDDIRLYAETPAYATATEPDTANLVAYYQFEGNVNDSSGNGYNGVENGAPSYAAGFDGQALSLRGLDDYIRVETVGVDPCQPRTIAGWVKASSVDVSGFINVFGFTGPSADYGHFDMQVLGSRTPPVYGLHIYGMEWGILELDLEWHHLAGTFDGSVVACYGDGQLVSAVDIAPESIVAPGQVQMGSREDNANYYGGLIDEVRIYDRALTSGEVAGLAGRSGSLSLPF